MVAPFSYSKPRFILGYAWWKLATLWEIQARPLQFFLFEIRYSIANFVRGAFQPNRPVTVWSSPDELIKTRFGQYRVRSSTQDAAIVSPAFERQDLNCLMNLVHDLLKNARVSFVDVGANIGKYPVTLLRTFPTKSLSAIAFEPLDANFQILRENLKLNGVEDRCSVYGYAVSNYQGHAEFAVSTSAFGNSSLKHINGGFEKTVEVEVTTLDQISLPTTDSVVVMKIDVEGAEAEVLQGAQTWISRHDRVYMMIEDAMWTEELANILRKINATMIKKLTPYNSWWLVARNPRINSLSPSS